jgi:hypothetical protein
MIIWDCGYCETTNPPDEYTDEFTCRGCGHYRMREFERDDYNLTPNPRRPRNLVRSPFPESSYWMDGGVSLRATPALNTVWR